MTTVNLQPQNILNSRARLGEGPVWDARIQGLYWVDIYNRRVHRFDPASGADKVWDLDTVVSGISLVAEDPSKLIVAQRHGLGVLDLATGTAEPLVAIEADRPHTRLNDLKCDPQGRLWVGTMHNHEQPEAHLYRYDKGSLEIMETGLSISNGLGWSPDGQLFYLTDSPRQIIYAYSFDLERGDIGDRRPFIDLTPETFYPDGLSVDSEGCLWSAMWNGGCLIRFDPDGQEMTRMALPLPLVTSCAFGGADLTELFITTASVGLSQLEIQTSVCSGDLFWLKTQVRGLPATPYGGLLGA
ncbi:gluconolaconase [filamentous cyanobacterium CCP5]|nr:gluconolaconase [filamentous cyanobacterium CCP5]